MKNIKFELKLGKFQIDAQFGNCLVEYKSNVSDLRVLQSAFLMISSIISDFPGHKGILIIDETDISDNRLKEEWFNLSKFIKTSILSRMNVVIFSGKQIVETFGDLNYEEIESLQSIQKKLKIESHSSHKRSDAFYEILRLLLIFWFRRSGPIRIKNLIELSGFSYPTVAASLERLETKLMRYSDRSVELKIFPGDEWFKLTASNQEVRRPQGYIANPARPITILIEKLEKMQMNDWGLGGVIGTKYYFPKIDLLGVPRLDISVIKWGSIEIEKFIKSLDPGLKKAKSGEVPQVIIHNVSRNESFFNIKNKLHIADEVECLLDLQESRLETQALEFLDHLKGKAKI
jgi:hypothetical protein